MDADDRVDVYLDRFHLHHEIPLRRRLTLEPYTAPASDVLLVKLQRTSVTAADIRDVIALLKDAELRDDEAPGAIGLRYFALACAREWGLYHDVTANLDRVDAAAGSAGLDASSEERLRSAVATVRESLVRARKGPRWRLCALAGERVSWHDVVDESEGQRMGLRERPAAGGLSPTAAPGSPRRAVGHPRRGPSRRRD